MALPLTQHELDDTICPHCGQSDSDCDFVIHSTCHPSAATWVRYVKGSGVIVITCAECEKEVAEIEVAE